MVAHHQGREHQGRVRHGGRLSNDYVAGFIVLALGAHWLWTKIWGGSRPTP